VQSRSEEQLEEWAKGSDHFHVNYTFDSARALLVVLCEPEQAKWFRALYR